MSSDEQHGEREHHRLHEAFDLTNGRPEDILETMAKVLERCLALRMLRREEALTGRLLCRAVLDGIHADVDWLLASGGADANTVDEDGDPLLNVAVSLGDVGCVRLLLQAHANVESRDTDGATPLVLACMQGRTECADALLSEGALVASRWQGLQPVQWAKLNGHEEAVSLCTDFGGELYRLPFGAGRVDTNPYGRNRLRPVPSTSARGARLQIASKAAKHTSKAERRAAAWQGLPWVRASLLQAVQQKQESDPELKMLATALRSCLEIAKLTREVVSSFSIRPGIRLRRDRNDPKLAASKTVDASIFGRPDAAPHFVEVDHRDPMYKHFFGHLLLTFQCVHLGQVHELCYIKYVWPDDCRYDGTPFVTRYSFVSKNMYEVLDVSSVLRRVPLMAPPLLEPLQNGVCVSPYFILNDDIYGRF